MGNDLYLGKRTVVLVFAVMNALLYGASNRFVCNITAIASAASVFVFHVFSLLENKNIGTCP